jgi:hypothetical protein
MKAAANNMNSAAYPRRSRIEAEDFIFMGFMSESVVRSLSELRGMPRGNSLPPFSVMPELTE